MWINANVPKGLSEKIRIHGTDYVVSLSCVSMVVAPSAARLKARFGGLCGIVITFNLGRAERNNLLLEFVQLFLRFGKNLANLLDAIRLAAAARCRAHR